MFPQSLRYVELTLRELSANLDWDLAALEEVDRLPERALLRVWEYPRYVVIIGRSNDLETEVELSACRADGVEVLRRASGGGAVVLGPGCLCYSLVLPAPHNFLERGIHGVTVELMNRLASGLSTPAQLVEVQGISDLTLGGRKFSGNSQRWHADTFLHHGTILYDFDIGRIIRYLKPPSRQPDYRVQREHVDFLTNLFRPRDQVIQALRETWNAWA